MIVAIVMFFALYKQYLFEQTNSVGWFAFPELIEESYDFDLDKDGL